MDAIRRSWNVSTPPPGPQLSAGVGDAVGVAAAAVEDMVGGIVVADAVPLIKG
jgi:hypothetical protein